MSSRCETICSIQIPTITLSNKEFPSKLIFTHERSSSHLKDICTIEILFTALQAHAWREAQLAAYYSSSPRLRAHLTWSRTPLPISRAQLALQGLYCAFFCALGDQTSPIHTSDTTKFGARLWYHLLGFGAPSQKISLLGGVAQILIYPRPSSCLPDVGIFVRLKSQQIFHRAAFKDIFLTTKYQYSDGKHIVIFQIVKKKWIKLNRGTNRKSSIIRF